MKITAELFEAFLKCPTKCWLRATGERSNGNTYAEWVKTQNQSYRVIGTKRLVEQSLNCEVAASPTSESLMATKWQLATSLTVQFQKNQSVRVFGSVRTWGRHFGHTAGLSVCATNARSITTR